MTVANGETLEIKQKGDIKLNDTITLNNVLIHPKLPINLLSVARLTDGGATFIFDKKGARLVHHNKTILHAKRHGNLYAINNVSLKKMNKALIATNKNELTTNKPAPIYHTTNPDVNRILESLSNNDERTAYYWHIRLNHLSYNKLNDFAALYPDRFAFIKNVNINKMEKINCAGCAKGKLTRNPFANATSSRTPATEPLQRIFFDTSGRIKLDDDPIKSALFTLLGAAEYGALIVDDYSGFIHGNLITTKGQAINHLINNINKYENM